MILFFWIFLGAIVYCYAGYPLAIYLLAKFFSKPIRRGAYEPSVSIVISAFNEEDDIERKLVNLLNMDYPEYKLEILIGSDGGSDQTDQIISKFQSPRVRFFRFVKNQGKPQVLNALLRESKSDVILFTDARQEFKRDAVKRLVENFADPKVGCVSGELYFKDVETGTAKGMDAYWSYEKFIRRAESEVASMLGATGAIYAIRRSVFSPLPADILVDDMYIPLSIVKKGFRAVFDHRAHAFDRSSDKGQQEFKRKIRTLAGNYQIFKAFAGLFNPFASSVAIQLFSHKLLRLWIPFLLLGVFVTNVFLIFNPFYFLFFVGQCCFYALAGLEYGRESRTSSGSQRRGIGYIPYMFCLLNYSAFAAFFYYFSNKYSVTWERAYVSKK